MATLGFTVGFIVKVYTSTGNTDVVLKALVATMALTAAVGFLGYKYGAQWISIDFERGLRWALIGLVVLNVIGLFFAGKHMEAFFYFLALSGAILFTLLLLAYHKNLRINAETCKKPLYPQESFGLIIKIVNLFTDIMRLLRRRR